jgi:hypothetical protein
MFVNSIHCQCVQHKDSQVLSEEHFRNSEQMLALEFLLAIQQKRNRSRGPETATQEDYNKNT